MAETPTKKLTGVLTEHLAKMPGDEAEARIAAADAALRNTRIAYCRINARKLISAWRYRGTPVDERLVLMIAEQFAEALQQADEFNREIGKLRGFIRALFEKSGWPEGNSVDYVDLQELAEKHGLLIPETVTAPCGESCWCEEYHGLEAMVKGVRCLRKVAWLS